MDFKTVDNKIRGPKIVIKKSRFIASIYPVNRQEDIDKEIIFIKKEMRKASHSAYAYRIIENGKIREDINDDGEVPSTAGLPILNVITGNKLMNVLLVVTRFYGGTNLGKGGLIRAYSGTAKDLIENVKLVEFQN